MKKKHHVLQIILQVMIAKQMKNHQLKIRNEINDFKVGANIECYAKVWKQPNKNRF